MDIENIPPGGSLLFVDDEKSILRSLQREFIDSPYEIYLAESAKDGLSVLERVPVDIVISDYKMPGMDGMELLKVVRSLYPSVYRVILSGYIDQQAVLRALTSGLATIYIAKPWVTEELQDKIEHLFNTRRALKNEEIIKTVNSVEELPVLSNVYNEFVRAVDDERPNEELAGIIARDPAITTKLLRVASSGYYNLGGNISLERALAYIGRNAIKEVLLLTSLSRSSHQNGTMKEHLRHISVHSTLVNYGISELYRIRNGKPLPQHLSSIGITHDIGKVIMLGYFSGRYDEVIAHGKDHPDIDFFQSEIELGFEGATHAEIGAYFLDLWGLPQASVEASLYHHDVKGPSQDRLEPLRICQTANLLANYASASPDAGDETLPGLVQEDPEQTELLSLAAGLREKWEEGWRAEAD